MSQTPRFNTPYIGKMSAFTDWVAGGNFDGYIYADVLTFYEKDRVVTWEHNIVASCYDDKLPANILLHTASYDLSDDRAIKFLGYRGRFLDDDHRYLVLDPPRSESDEALCFMAEIK